MSEDRLVTIATYQFAPQGELARALLEGEGIRAFLMDANTVNADWFLGNALGYAKLQVLESQAEAALKHLEANPGLLDRGNRDRPSEQHDPDKDVCLSCGQPMPESTSRCLECGWSYHDA